MVTFTVDQNAVNFEGQEMWHQFRLTHRGFWGTQTVTDTSLNIDHPISKNPSITVTKTYQTFDNDSDGVIGAGDVIRFNVTILNTGDVTLKDFSLDDTFTDLQTNTLTFTNPLTTADPNELLRDSSRPMLQHIPLMEMMWKMGELPTQW